MKNLDRIVDLIIKELFKVDDLNNPKQRVIMNLLKSGIDPEEIDKAFHFIIKKIHQYENNKTIYKEKKFRILTTRERSRLSREAHRYLYNYYYNDTITWKEMEIVINNIERMERVVDVNGLNKLIEKVLFDKNLKSIKVNSSIIH